MKCGGQHINEHAYGFVGLCVVSDVENIYTYSALLR